MDRAVTIKDVARVAGVGHSTVSRVINGSDLVSEDTRARVEAALEELGYRPNLVARGLVNQRTQALGIITPPLAPHTEAIIGSVASEARSCGYATLLCPAETWEEESLAVGWMKQNWLVDGILVYNLLHHDDVPQDILDLQASGTPIVFIKKFLDDRRLNAVGVDVREAVLKAVRHLAERGHRRIGTLTGHRLSEDGAARYTFFQDALKEVGLEFEPALMRDAVWVEDIAREKTRELLELSDPPTALFCANDHMALGALAAARDLGRRVPEDVALVGYDDIEVAHHVQPALTTIRPPLHEVGRQAVSLMMRILADPERPPEQLLFNAELIVREST